MEVVLQLAIAQLLIPYWDKTLFFQECVVS